MDEQRNESTGAVRRGLRFYARCAQEAWRRSWDASKAWPPILGLMALTGGAWLAGVDLTFPGDIEHGAAIGTGLFVVTAWVAVFLTQFVAAPPRLHAQLETRLAALSHRPAPLLLTGPAKSEAPAVDPTPATQTRVPAESPLLALPAPTPTPAPSVEPVFAPPLPLIAEPEPAPMPVLQRRPAPPPIDVRLHDQAYETTAVDATGARLPAARAYVARVANRGSKAVRRCQIFFCNPMHVQVVSGPFDLAPGEHRDLPVLRVIDEADEPHALLYFLDGETWAVADGQAAWLPEPGRFKVKVLSANAPAAALDVALACSASTPLAWTLVEADSLEPEREAAPADRKRAGWKAAGAVVERGAGD